VRKHFNVAAQKITADDLLVMEPAFKPGVAGAWYYEQDAHLRPDRLMDSWRDVLARRGVIIRENCAARGFTRGAGRLTAVVTDDGEISGDAFIVATGALTPLLEKHLGCKIPIQPGKGYSITMPRPHRCPKYPMIFPEVKVAVTPFQSGYRLGSTMEFSGYDTTLNRRRLDALREGAALFLHEPFCEPVQEEWYGWRPMTYDSVPIVGRLPAAENLFIAAGHNMLGLSMAPGTGKLVAEMVTGERPHIEAALYSPTRFS
jgi:D-amino-acid dehydrogenase